jgi:hypothetical protein
MSKVVRRPWLATHCSTSVWMNVVREIEAGSTRCEMVNDGRGPRAAWIKDEQMAWSSCAPRGSSCQICCELRLSRLWASPADTHMAET